MRQSCLLPGLLLLAASAGFTSCVDSSFLNETQTTDLSKEVVFSDSTYTVGFLNHIYADIAFDVYPNRFGPGGLQTACDESDYKTTSYATDGVQFVSGTVNPVSINENTWRTCYRNIRAVNVFLANADDCPMVSSALTRYKAEARFLRAWYYFMLVRHYGGVPLLYDEVYDNENYETIDMTRNTFEECIDYIVDECKEASKDLRVRAAGSNFGRASGGSCQALIARALLYAASPLFNGTTHTDDPRLKAVMGYPEADQERWKDAADAALKFISNGMWEIYVRHQDKDDKNEPGWGFYAQFQGDDYANKNTHNGHTYNYGALSGCILSAIHNMGSEKETIFDPPTCNQGAIPDGGYPTLEMVECFPMKDGAKPGEGKYSYNRLLPAQNRDPRFANSITYNGLLRYNNTSQITVYTFKGLSSTVDAIGGQATTTGFYWRKALHRDTHGNWWIGVSQTFQVLRYEEVLLNYAEATNEYYGPDHVDAVGDQTISPMQVLCMLRERAGIEAGADGNYGLKANMTQNQMREAIRLERRIELACEGHRFFDVRRWMIADETENAMVHGWEITHKTDGSFTGRVIDARQHVFRKAMYFWPIPYNEVMRSSDLLQNPYYD